MNNNRLVYICSFIKYFLALFSKLILANVILRHLVFEGTSDTKVNSIVTLETVNRVRKDTVYGKEAIFSFQDGEGMTRPILPLFGLPIDCRAYLDILTSLTPYA